MSEYTLTPDAEQDLLEIARYTISKWGPEQEQRYEAALVTGFMAIAQHDAFEKAVFEHRDDFRVSRCQHHHVFFIRNDEQGVLILAVLHKSMDLVARLGERLEAGGHDG